MNTQCAIERLQSAKATIYQFSALKESTKPGSLYDEGKAVVQDLITDLCHLLHTDTEIGGCMDAEEVQHLLSVAFDQFAHETTAPDKTFYASLCIGDGGGYVRITAKDMDEAREKMFASKYGKQWAFMYPEEEKENALDRFGQVEKDYIP